MTTYYHGSSETITVRSGALCVTTDESAASEYGPVVQVVELRDGLRLADVDDVRAVAREVAPNSPYTSAWELVEEHRAVRQALVAAGYDGVEYADMTPDNRREHRTVMLFDASRCVVSVRFIA